LNTLQHKIEGGTKKIRLKHTANTFQHASTRFHTLQHAATRFNTLQHCNTLQNTTMHCNALQCTSEAAKRSG